VTEQVFGQQPMSAVNLLVGGRYTRALGVKSLVQVARAADVIRPKLAFPKAIETVST